MELQLLLIDDEHKVLARGSVEAMAGSNGWIYAMDDGHAEAVADGQPTHTVVVMSALIKLKIPTPGIPYVYAGSHILCSFQNQLIAKNEGDVMDPLEVE